MCAPSPAPRLLGAKVTEGTETVGIDVTWAIAQDDLPCDAQAFILACWSPSQPYSTAIQVSLLHRQYSLCVYKADTYRISIAVLTYGGQSARSPELYVYVPSAFLRGRTDMLKIGDVPKPDDLVALSNELAELRLRVHDTAEKERDARSNATYATNLYNAAKKRWQDAVATMNEWHSVEGRK